MGHDRPGRQERPLLTNALRSATQFAARRPRFTLSLVTLMACVSVGVTVSSIDFKTKRADLIDPRAPFHRRWIDYTESFGDAADIVVVVEADDPETIREALEDIGSQMTRQPDLFDRVLYRFDPGKLRQKGLHYLSPAQLEQSLKQFAEYRPVLQGRWELLRLESFASRLNLRMREELAAGARNDRQAKRLIRQADLLAVSLSRYLKNRGEFRSPWPDIVPSDPLLGSRVGGTVYLINEEETMGFVKAHPIGQGNDFNGASQAIDRLRGLIEQTSKRYPSARIGVTGIPVLENDEMRRSRADMMKASAISFLGVGLLLMLGFRGIRHPILALLMLAIGMAWSLGYTTVAIGHLNILSVSFAVILIGLGIDFAIHYLARYLELRHDGRLLRPALLETSSGVGTGIVTAAVTTAMAFFCATFTQFLGVAELGIIVGGGILLCAAATFLVLPALVSLADQRVEPRKLPTPFEGRLLRVCTARFPATVTVLSALIIVGVGVQVFRLSGGRLEPRIRYDYNLLNLQADGLESIEIQKRLFRDANDSLLYAVSMADSPAEAVAMRKKFEALPTVHHVEELASRLPSHSKRETALLMQAVRAELARIPSRPPRLPGVNPARLGSSLEGVLRSLRGMKEATAQRTVRTLDDYLDRLERLPLNEQAAMLNAYQARMASALLGQFRSLKEASRAGPVTLDDLPEPLRSRFVSSEGKWLLEIYPKEQIWDVEPLSRFVADVRSVDPDVTGTPLQNYEASHQILESYRTASIYALVVICVVLLVDFLGPEHKLPALLPPLAVVVFAAMIVSTRGGSINVVFLVIGYVGMAFAISAVLDFRNLRDVMLTMLPPLGGGLLMFGILALLGVDLNPANLIVLPLVLGIGVDDGVHVIHDFRSQSGPYRTSSSTINAIVLTSLTSMIGFGSMMLAAHRGLWSVGLVLVVGIGSCLFVSLVTLPAVLTLFSGSPSGAGEGKRPKQSGGAKPQARKAA